MPTYGWVNEDALEAFYAGTEKFGGPRPPPDPIFHCPFCAHTFSDRKILQGHVSGEHKVERPALLIRDREPSRRSVLRAVVSADDILVANTTSISLGLNGWEPKKISMDDFPNILSTVRNAEANITISNESQVNATPIVTQYDLSVLIASPSELREVEDAFAEIIMKGDISRESVSRFLQDNRANGVGSEYASGLAEYTLGVLLKERPKTEALTTPFSRYRESFGSSLQILTDFERPLAYLICDAIRFALNDFSKASTNNKSGYWELDQAIALLTESEVNPIRCLQDEQEARSAICPIDHGTGQILSLAARMVNQNRWSQVLDEECRRAASSETLDVTDRQKVLAIWAISAWRLEAKESAAEPLRQIAATYPFSIWAAPYLESLTN